MAQRLLNSRRYESAVAGLAATLTRDERATPTPSTTAQGRRSEPRLCREKSMNTPQTPTAEPLAPLTGSAPPSQLNPGQVWWDEHRNWCDGSDTLDVVYLLLSADQEGELYVWRCAFFMWVGGGMNGYCGAHDRKFTEDEVRMMTYAGAIDSIKNFKAQNEPNSPTARS